LLPGPRFAGRAPAQGVGGRGLGVDQQQGIPAPALIASRGVPHPRNGRLHTLTLMGRKTDATTWGKDRLMNQGCSDFRMTCRLSRRSLLKIGSAGIAGLNLPALLRASEASAFGRGPKPHAKHV